MYTKICWISFTPAKRHRASTGLEVFFFCVCVCVGLALFWCGFPGEGCMWCGSMRNVSQRTGLGSFLQTSRGVADGTYLARFQTRPAIGRYFCCLLPKSFHPMLPLQACFQNSSSWLHLVEPSSAGKLGQLCPGPGAWDNFRISPIHFLSLSSKDVYRICISPWLFFFKSWVRLNLETTVDYVMKPYLWHSFLPQLDSVKKTPQNQKNNQLTKTHTPTPTVSRISGDCG